MVCLDRQNISSVVLATAIHMSKHTARYGIELPRSQTELEVAIGELESLALITRRSHDQCFAAHRLVQAITLQSVCTAGELGAYSVCSARCIMELFLNDVHGHLRCHEDEVLDNAQQFVPSIERIQRLLQQSFDGATEVPQILPDLSCRLGIYFSAQGESMYANRCFANALRYERSHSRRRRIAWLQCVCSPPSEAIALAAKFDLRFGEITFSHLEDMEKLDAQGPFDRLETMSLQAIRQSTARSDSMVAAKIYLARAVAGIGLHMSRKPITALPFDVLIREADDELDGMTAEQRMSPHRHYNTHLLAATYFEIGCVERAIHLQERAYRELKIMFGSKDLDVLGYRVCLAEMKGQYSITSEELQSIEHVLQTVYYRMRNPKDPSAKDDRGALTAISLLGRVKVLIYRKLLEDWTGPAINIDETLSKALSATEIILRGSILQMEKLLGVFNLATMQKTNAVYEFLEDMGPSTGAGDFAFERATSMLNAMSNCNFLGDRRASVFAQSIRSFAKHDHVRPLCEELLAAYLCHLKMKRSHGSIAQTTQAMWSTLELIQATRIQSPESEPFVELKKMVEHDAMCDKCDQVWHHTETVLSSWIMLTGTVDRRHSPQMHAVPGL